MGSAKGILLALATVFVAAECFLPFAIRREISPSSDDTGSSCGERLASCGTALITGGFNVYDMESITGLIDNIEGICQRQRQLADCVLPLLDECVTVRRVAIDATLAVGEYICSDRGRSLLTESTDSVCYSDPSQLDVIHNLSTDCVTSRFNDSLTQCQNNNIIIACAVEATTQQCGQAFGDFTRELTNRIVATVPRLQC